MHDPISVQSDAEWHALRATHVGGSEVAALFGEHANITRLELWHRKTGGLAPDDLSDNERVFWGTILEPAIVEGIKALRPGPLADCKADDIAWAKGLYYKHPRVKGMGASPDCLVDHPTKGLGCIQIKCADSFVFRSWEDGEPPLSYVLQNQHEMACADAAWGMVVVLVGGNRLEHFVMERHAGTVSHLETAVAEFWRSVESKQAPQPVFPDDNGTIRALLANADGKPVDLTGVKEVETLCREYLSLGPQISRLIDQKDTAKAKLLLHLGDAPKALCGAFSISAGMIGEAIIPAYTRRSYRDFRIHQKKAKAA
jgi:putative phage-type endonuclease